MIIRRRLVYWLVKEYIKKWGKRFALYFLLGCLLFFFLRLTGAFLLTKFVLGQKNTIGVSGAYTLSTLPPFIIKDISYGLTVIDSDGTPKPGACSSWEIHENGKVYVFYLKQGLFFSDGTPVTSKDIDYNFTDAKIERPSPYALVFRLKDVYAPFLVSVSRPIFKKGFIGIGQYKIKDIKINGNFIESLSLASIKDAKATKTYQFYATADAVKTAYMLGEVKQAVGVSDMQYKGQQLVKFPNTSVDTTVDYTKLVSVFFNTGDPVVSDKKIREALTYALPDLFKDGDRAFGPFPKTSWAYDSGLGEKTEDLSHASLLLKASAEATDSGKISLSLTTLEKYSAVAQRLKKEWSNIGIDTKITYTNSLPGNFQLFLGDFNLPQDPDQYSLWHSTQDNNITHYNNKRIDKLLEDGRKTTDMEERKKLYLDFQKYLVDDAPALFLYFPYQYTLNRQ